MHLLIMMVIMVMMVTMGKTAAQSYCDPNTQYEKAGQCCTLCAPGTSMSVQSSCTEPQCIECGEKEYQDKYNSERQCRRQPYCDPNKNFQVFNRENKKERSTCLCELGFHCSSKACLTCVPHAVCTPGHWAQSPGNQTHDTVCQKCPEGSFSTSNSWYSVCTKWTECESGFHITQSGTGVSDSVCEKTSRQRVVTIVVFLVVMCSGILLGVAYYLCRGDSKWRKKACPNSCKEEQQELQRDDKLLTFTPVDDSENGPLDIEHPFSHEECSTRTPEENIEDESKEDTFSGVLVTENGNCLTQETGKEEIQSQEETQTLTLTIQPDNSHSDFSLLVHS